MLFGLISILGIPLGILIAKYTKEELKQGEKWFKLLQAIILIFIILITIWLDFNLVGFVIGILFGLYFKREYFYFGLAIISSSFNKNINFLLSSLVFLYGLPYGTLLYNKKIFNKISLDIILFLIPIILIFLKFDFDLLSFSIGALIPIAIKKQPFKSFLT